MAKTGDDSSLPIVMIHRYPTFTSSMFPALSTHFRIVDPLSTDASPSLLRSATALLCVGPPPPVTSDFLDRFPSIGIVVCSSVGVDHVDLPECRRRGVAVTNAGPAFAEDVADYAVALLIDVLRSISAGDRYVRAGRWPVQGDYPLGSKLGGKRVGILGLGRIGSLIATRLAAFGCQISYCSRSERPSLPYRFYSTALDLAANNDVIIACCSLTDETFHVINGEVMKALGKRGVIVNVGRGALIDEKELVQLLVRGDLGGAGLDVFEDEPNVAKELFALDNVVMSPHSAVITPESIGASQDISIRNLTAFFSKQPLISPVQD
ncbi:Glyoxylate/hydroxypyruvate reductase HPR3 [Linum grandiflorum]